MNKLSQILSRATAGAVLTAAALGVAGCAGMSCNARRCNPCSAKTQCAAKGGCCAAKAGGCTAK